MTIFTLPNVKLLLVAAVFCAETFAARAFTFSLHEQGGLTGFVNGGGGTVSITLLGPDHWQVFVQDSRVGSPISAGLSLAYIEPEPVGGNVAYNNIQVVSVVPGTAVFDVLSDEISPYSTVVPDGAVVLIQPTTQDPIYLRFTDVADTIPEPGSATLLLGGGVLLLAGRARGRCGSHELAPME